MSVFKNFKYLETFLKIKKKKTNPVKLDGVALPFFEGKIKLSSFQTFFQAVECCQIMKLCNMPNNNNKNYQLKKD